MYIIDTMVRKRKPLSKVKLSDEILHQAIFDVKEKKLSLRAGADFYGIAKSTLARLVNKTGSDGTIIIKHDRRQVFTTDQEHKLSAYLVEAAMHHAGLTKVMVRQLAYEYAQKLEIDYPTTWTTNEKAG